MHHFFCSCSILLILENSKIKEIIIQIASSTGCACISPSYPQKLLNRIKKGIYNTSCLIKVIEKAKIGLPIELNAFREIEVEDTNGSINMDALKVFAPIDITVGELVKSDMRLGAYIPNRIIITISISVTS